MALDQGGNGVYEALVLASVDTIPQGSVSAPSVGQQFTDCVVLDDRLYNAVTRIILKIEGAVIELGGSPLELC